MSAVKNHNMAEPDPAIPLFRPQVLALRSSQSLGAITLAQPLSAALIASVTMTIAIALGSFIAFGSIDRKARVTGIIVPTGGSHSISAANTGTLTRVFVEEGKQIRAGDPLFEISTERRADGGEITALIGQQLLVRQQALRTERRTQISQAAEKKRSIEAKLLNLFAETAQLEQEITLAGRRQDLAQKSLSKFEILQTSGYVSSSQTQQKQEELIDAAARLSALQRNKVQLNTVRLRTEEERMAMEGELATNLSQLDRTEASLQQEVAENANRRSVIISATHAGVVATITNQPGQTVASGQVLGTIIPVVDHTAGRSSQFEAHLYAPSRTAGFITAGQQVLLRYQAYPYQKFGLYKGLVTDISRTSLAPSELPQNIASTIISNVQQHTFSSGGSEALYRIKVKLSEQSINVYGKEQALKPGMTLDADILQENRKIWEWILEPILATTQR